MLGAAPKERTNSARPNVLFIMTDQQTASAMSVAGNEYLHTPNLDSLAARGILFRQSYCTAPVCSPSRSSLVTSRMPHETGVPHNEHQQFDTGLPSMGSLFRHAGYETAWTGKWHLPTSYPKESAIPGFDYLQPSTRPERDFSGTIVDAYVADSAIEFLTSAHATPFLLGVSFHNPHDICGLPSEGYPEPDDGKPLPPLPPNFAVDPGEPEFISRQRKREQYGPENTRTVGWSDDQWRYYLHRYYRFVEAVDVHIGRVLDALRQAHIEENTLVIFTSDHGEGVAAHQWVVKLMLYDEPTRVPLIVSWPGVIPHRVEKRHLASGLDIVPTMCDYADIPIPSSLRGKSLRKSIESPHSEGRPFVVTELHITPEEEGRMIRTALYTYVVFSTGASPEMLFDRIADPGEMNNLAQDPARRGVLEWHRRTLEEWMATTGDGFQAECLGSAAG